jgi:hypothetical protein
MRQKLSFKTLKGASTFLGMFLTVAFSTPTWATNAREDKPKTNMQRTVPSATPNDSAPNEQSQSTCSEGCAESNTPTQ